MTRAPSSRGFLSGMALVLAYGVLMTLDAPPLVLAVWTVAAATLALASLTGGLTVLAALGPFTEALTDAGEVTAVPFLLAALGAGLLVEGGRAALARQIRRPPAVLALAAALFVLTLLAVAISALYFGSARGIEALQFWVAGIGGGLTVLFAAWLVGRRGETRPLTVLLTSITLAALLSAVGALQPGGLGVGPFEWLLRPHGGSDRLTGIIPAPNAAAAIFLTGIAGLGAYALLGRRLGVRLLAATAAALLVGVTVMTYSRSGLAALAAVATVLAWRWRGWLALVAIAVLGVVGVAGALAFPELGLSREVPFWADEDRLEAWAASFRMWLEQPLFGHGLRSFEWLHASYGSELDAPHNEWLRFFAEGGIVTGLAALGLAAAALVTLLRARGWVSAAGAGALGAIVLMAAFNNPFLYVQVNVPVFLLLGLAVGVATGQPLVPARPPAPGPMARKHPTTRDPLGGESGPVAPGLPRTVIQPADRWPGLGLREFWDQRRLCLVLARRNLKVRYRQTVIGAGWAILQPTLLMLAFTVFFGLLARIPSDGLPYPVFFLMGLVPYQMVSKILNEGSTSIVANGALVNRVYLPRAYFPTSVALASLVDVALVSLVLAVFLAASAIVPGVTVLLAPLLFGIAWVAALGAAYWLSALNVAYRDITQMLPFLTQIWMFATPIIYPASLVPEEFRALYFLNPLAFVVSAFRWAVAGAPPPPLEAWVLGPAVAVLLLASGYVFFRQRERNFADLI